MNRVVLVTGGTGGIGAALCRRLAAIGDHPIIGYRGDADAALTLATEIGGDAVKLDMADASSIEAAVVWMKEKKPEVSTLVLAASPPPTLAPFGKITDADLSAQWEVNVLGVRRLVAGLAKACFRKRKQGQVIGVLSAAMGDGRKAASSNMGAYVIAKYGLQGVLAAAAADYPWLKASWVSPGFTETPMLNAFDDRFLEMTRAHAPGGRFATAEEVAGDILACMDSDPT